MSHHRQIRLPYGSRPYELLLETPATVVDLPHGAPGLEVRALLEAALEAPIGSPRLEQLARRRDRVLLIVSDATRHDPRDELLASVRERLPDGVDLTIAIANGTHAPRPVESLGIDRALLAGATIVNHDARDPDSSVAVGHTRRGTPVRVNRVLLDADLVIATGRVKPHYFAGFGAGCKAIFPGLGEERAIRINHRLKSEAGATSGVIDGNPCRDDLLEAARMATSKSFLLNAVFDGYDRPSCAFAGDLDGAFRRAAERARALFCVRAPRSRLVIASDTLPLTASLYQASKLAAGVAALVEPGGAIVLVAECGEGTGPVDTVNKAIYDIGVRPRLPEDHTVFLVSSLEPRDVEPTYCRWVASVEELVSRFGSEVKPVIVPRAGTAIVKVTDHTPEFGASSGADTGASSGDEVET